AWSLFPEHMAPYEEGVHTGKTFGLILTLMLCFTAEILFVKIPTPKNYPPLPPLLASLLTGLALKNLPAPANIAAHIDEDVSRTLRELALTVILTRAGLEIDPEGMAKVKWAVIRLAFMPCIAETVTIGITANLILGFPFLWSFMMGFMIAAVSPAVVIPSLIILQDKGLGVAKGVPSLVMAASGIDDVLAIAGFTVLLGLAIPTGLEEEIESFISQTFGAIIEIIIGIISGLVLGMLISYIPSKKMRYRHFCRGFLLLTIGIVFVFGTELWGIPGAGALCALVTSFTASLQWKEETKPLEKSWHFMWTVFQPILFGLTGTLVDVGMM
uniref:Cation/H+ exchanger transmembrane domain-containing protein n=1 Tax=Ciona savignyi TaxID=51511 RepID=H2YWT6_CIOSA